TSPPRAAIRWAAATSPSCGASSRPRPAPSATSTARDTARSAPDGGRAAGSGFARPAGSRLRFAAVWIALARRFAVFFVPAVRGRESLAFRGRLDGATPTQRRSMRRHTRTIVVLAAPLLAALAFGCAKKAPGHHYPGEAAVDPSNADYGYDYGAEYEEGSVAYGDDGAAGADAVASSDAPAMAGEPMSESEPEPEPTSAPMLDEAEELDTYAMPSRRAGKARRAERR